MPLLKGDIIVDSFPVGGLACNCSMIYSNSTKEAIIVDPGNDSSVILSYIKEKNLKVKKLLHTHAHFDHIGRSSEIKEHTKATLHLHKDDKSLYESLKQQAMFFGDQVGSVSPIDEYLENEQEHTFLSQDLNFFIKTIHTPGHTQGSCCFYSDFFDTPLLLSGDTLFRGSIGRTDFPGGDYGQLIKSIKNNLLHLPDETIVIPGHGPSTQIFQEKKSNPFL